MNQRGTIGGLLFAVVLVGSLVAWGADVVRAQTTTGSAAGEAAVKAGARVLVDEAGKAAGRIFTKEQVKLIRDVLGAAAGANAGADDAVSGSGSETKSRKGKGAKGKKGKSKGLPPGLAKKNTLPPGLQKQLAKGGSLPPGLAKRSLPDDLDTRLGDPSPGTERVIVDNDVALIEKGHRNRPRCDQGRVAWIPSAIVESSERVRRGFNATAVGAEWSRPLTPAPRQY